MCDAMDEGIDKARKILGLGEIASLKGIKKLTGRKLFYTTRIRLAAKMPKLKNVNQGYNLLVEYCSRYKYSFREEDIGRAYPNESYVRRYLYGWFEGM